MKNNNRISIDLPVARVLVISVFAAVIFAGIAGTDAAALSNAGGGSWQFYREITITNSGGALTDYQVLVQLSGTNFPINARPDGADIRFTDMNEKELSYWIEDWYFSGKTANVWVKVTGIPAGATTIRIYYGNPSASSTSNGATTFDFFDDFNSLGWQKFGNASQVSTIDGKSVVTITGWGEIVSPISLQSPNYAFASMSKLTSGMEAYMPFFDFGQSDRAGDEDNAYQFGYNVYWNALVDNIRIFKNSASVANQNGDNAHTQRTGWAKTEFMVFSGTLTQKVDDSSKGIQQIMLTDTGSWAGQIPKEVGIIVWNGTTYAVDWALIRKYTSPEPTVILGAEQIIPTPTPTSTPIPAITPTSTSTPIPAITPTPTPAPTPTATQTPIELQTVATIIPSQPIPTQTPAPTPVMSVSPDPPSFYFGTLNAGDSASQVFSISNSGGGTLTWTIRAYQPWITINPTSGINSGTVTINISTAGLSPGSYSGVIEVTSNGGAKTGSVSFNISTPKKLIPGFEVALAVAGLISVAYIVVRRRK